MMHKVDLLGKTELEWYKLYKSFIDSIPMGYVEDDGSIKVLSYDNCRCLYECVKGKNGKFVVFDKPSVSVCKEIVYNSSLENLFDFFDRVNNMSYEKRLKMINKHNKDRGDYKWNLAPNYGKYLKVFRAALMDNKIEMKCSSSEPWEKISIGDLIECGPFALDYRVVGEYRGK